MSIRSAGFAMCILLAAGCSEAYSPTPEGVRPPSPKTAIPDCRPSHAMDEQSFALIVDILRRNGEVQRANVFYAQLRTLVEARLAQHDPGAVARMKPALDSFFSGAELEKRAVCIFTRFDRSQAEVEAWDGWSSDAKMREIHGRIAGFMQETPVPAGRVDDQRRALLSRVANATEFPSYLSVQMSAQSVAMALTEAALDPTSSELQDMALNRMQVRPPDELKLIDEILAPQLAGIADADLRRYLEFVETREGRLYYQTLVESYAYTDGEWYGRLGGLLKTGVKPAEVARDPAKAAKLLAEAQRLYNDVGTRVVVAEARTLLLKADRLDPENAEIKVMLGRVALITMPQGIPHEDGQIRNVIDRMHPKRPERYEEARGYFRKAIELDPKNADAHLYTGRIHFYLSEDEDARKQYAIARGLNPKTPNLQFYEADIAYVDGQYAKAESAYRQLLAAPEVRAFDHHFALRRLRLALMKQGREREFREAAEAQLKRDPELWDFRLEHAERLLATDGTVEEVSALLEPVPDGWLPDLKRAVQIRLQLLRVLQAAPSAQAAATRRAFAIAQDPMEVAEMACVARGRARIAAAVIRESGAQGRFADRLLTCSLWRRDIAFFDAVLPFVEDINRPNAAMEGQLPLCAAAAVGHPEFFEGMLKAKADPKRRCGKGNTPREMLAERAGRVDGDAAYVAKARAMLKVLDKYDRGDR